MLQSIARRCIRQYLRCSPLAEAAWSSNLSKREIVDLLGGKVPVGPANTLAEVLADPHVEARRMVERYDYPGSEPGGTFTASPIKFLNAPTRLYQRPPTHGEHTDEVLAEFGIKRP